MIKTPNSIFSLHESNSTSPTVDTKTELSYWNGHSVCSDLLLHISLFLREKDLLAFEICSKACFQALNLTWNILHESRPELKFLKWSDCRHLPNNHKWNYFLSLRLDQTISLIKKKFGNFPRSNLPQKEVEEIQTRYSGLIDHFPLWGSTLKKLLNPLESKIDFSVRELTDLPSGDAILTLILNICSLKSKKILDNEHVDIVNKQAKCLLQAGNTYAARMICLAHSEEPVLTELVKEIAFLAADQKDFYPLEVCLEKKQLDHVLELSKTYDYPPIWARLGELYLDNKPDTAGENFQKALDQYQTKAPYNLLSNILSIISKNNFYARDKQSKEIDCLYKQISKFFYTNDKIDSSFQSILINWIKIKCRLAELETNQDKKLEILKSADEIYKSYPQEIFVKSNLEYIAYLKKLQADSTSDKGEKYKFLKDAIDLYYIIKRDHNNLYSSYNKGLVNKIFILRNTMLNINEEEEYFIEEDSSMSEDSYISDQETDISTSDSDYQIDENGNIIDGNGNIVDYESD